MQGRACRARHLKRHVCQNLKMPRWDVAGLATDHTTTPSPHGRQQTTSRVQLGGTAHAETRQRARPRRVSTWNRTLGRSLASNGEKGRRAAHVRHRGRATKEGGKKRNQSNQSLKTGRCRTMGMVQPPCFQVGSTDGWARARRLGQLEWNKTAQSHTEQGGVPTEAKRALTQRRTHTIPHEILPQN